MAAPSRPSTPEVLTNATPELFPVDADGYCPIDDDGASSACSSYCHINQTNLAEFLDFNTNHGDGSARGDRDSERSPRRGTSETGLSSGFNRIDLGRRISSCPTDPVAGSSHFNSDQGPILDWETDLQELFNATTETAERSTREENSRLIFNFLREFRGALKGKKFIHDVLPNITSIENERYFVNCVRQKYQGGVFIWVWHEDHAHIVHDCSWAGGYCRCARLAGLPYKRGVRRARWNHSISEYFLFNLTKYFLEPPRRILYFTISGRKRLPPHQIGNVRYEEIASTAEESVVEGSDDQNEFSSCDTSGLVASSSRRSYPHGGSPHKKHKKSQEGSEEEKLLDFISKYPTSPLLNIVNTSIWINSEFKFRRRNDAAIQNVIDVLYLQILTYDIQGMFEFLKNSSPYFACTQTNVFDYYYTLVESLNYYHG